MAVFFETPWPFFLLGLATIGILGVGWVNTRHKGFLIGIAATIVLTLGGLGLEKLVVTDKEAIGDTIRAAGARLEANDLPGVLACISPDAKVLRAIANEGMRDFTSSDVTVKNNMTIDINRLTVTPKATVVFNVLYSGSGGGAEATNYPLVFKAILRKEGEKWVFTDQFDFGSQAERRRVLDSSMELGPESSIYQFVH